MRAVTDRVFSSAAAFSHSLVHFICWSFEFFSPFNYFVIFALNVKLMLFYGSLAFFLLILVVLFFCCHSFENDSCNQIFPHSSLKQVSRLNFIFFSISGWFGSKTRTLEIELGLFDFASNPTIQCLDQLIMQKIQELSLLMLLKGVVGLKLWGWRDNLH